jgi:hypothetical protein
MIPVGAAIKKLQAGRDEPRLVLNRGRGRDGLSAIVRRLPDEGGSSSLVSEVS